MEQTEVEDQKENGNPKDKEEEQFVMMADIDREEKLIDSMNNTID